MQPASIWVIATLGVALAGCVSAGPLSLSDGNPASPKAPAGFVDEPTAIADYKSPEDLANRAAAEAKAPPSSMANMPGMEGMKMPQSGAGSGNKPR